MFMIRTFLISYRATGYLFGHYILSILRKDLFVLGLTDLVMFLSTFFCLLQQKAIYQRYISWDGSGWIIQHVLALFYVANIGMARNLPWRSCRMGILS